MWKYIIIAAVVLFLGACFLFYKNNEALTGPEGEIAAVQAQFDMARKKAADIEKDKSAKQYAKLRVAYFQQMIAKNNDERAALEAEDAPFDQEITGARADLDAAKAELEDWKKKFKEFQKGAAAAIAQQGDEESASMETVDEDQGAEQIAQYIVNLIKENDDLKLKVEEEKGEVAKLEKEIELTKAANAAATKLADDRRARRSSPDLKCSVAMVDTIWDYVILDAGIDKEIVIGSRLNVMRNDQKVCELTVTLVESNRASCDVVYSTMRPGDAVRPGDIVVAANN